jgi:CheY-like chemotaxis protein
MAAQSLVLCRDPEALRTLCPLLFDMDIGVEICLGSNGASRMLRRQRFDAVIVECDPDGDGFELLEELRSDTPNQKTLAVGIVNDYRQMKDAFARGANFVLSKPISAQDASRILRFTRGMITRMVRRFLRVAVHHLAHVDIAGMTDPAFMLDLSEGGMAMQCLAPVRARQVLDIAFPLPDTPIWISGKGVVAWSDETGKVGLEFDALSEEDRLAIKNWVIGRLRQAPGDVPDAEVSAPRPIQVLTQWMRPMARVIDGAFVTMAAVAFCFIALLIAKSQTGATFPWTWVFATSLLLGGVLYSLLFMLMDVRFPGTRAVQSILSAAGKHKQPA